jgi:Fe2+ transport system protein FeoA
MSFQTLFGTVVFVMTIDIKSIIFQKLIHLGIVPGLVFYVNVASEVCSESKSPAM